MQTLMNLVLVVQLLSALVMIGLVLIQHGKGADMGASFGSGSSGSLFGATGSANFLSRSTAVAATIFFICTLALVYNATTGRAAVEGPRTVLDGVVSDPSTAPAQIPGTEAASGALAASAVVAPASAPAVEAAPSAAATVAPASAVAASAAK